MSPPAGGPPPASHGTLRCSVAMSTFNGATYLGEQLDSLARQTRLPDELVVADDGSTDATVELLRAFQAKAPFQVRLVTDRPRSGWRTRFLEAADLCAGEIVFFCDQDDVWLPEKIQRVAAVFEADPRVSLVAHSSRSVGPALEPIRSTQPAMIRRRQSFAPGQLPPLGGFPGHALAFRRRILPAVVPDHRPVEPPDFDWLGGVTHDQLIVAVAGAAGRTVLLPEVLVRHRLHQAAVTKGCPGRGNLESLDDAVHGRTCLLTPLEHTRTWALAWAEYFDALAKSEVLGAAAATGLVESARQQRETAALLARRSEAYSVGTGRLTRLSRVLRHAGHGDYRSRWRGGLGARSLVRDLLASSLGQPST